MMYEPPNRGGKTYQTLNRTPDGTNDPGALTEAAFPGELANSFLWTRGYTTVWSGWENNLGALSGLTATASLPVATNVRRHDDHRTRLRVHRQSGRDLYAGLSRCVGQPGSGERNADASHSPGRHPAGRSRQRLGIHRFDQHDDQADIGELRRQRHLRVHVHREESDRQRARIRRDSRLQLVPALCGGRRSDPHVPIRSPAT